MYLSVPLYLKLLLVFLVIIVNISLGCEIYIKKYTLKNTCISENSFYLSQTISYGLEI